MFLAPRQRKTTVFTRFWASASKNHGIYSVLWPGPSKNTGIYAVSCMLSEPFFGCQRHKNIVNYTIFTRGQYQKIMKNWPKIDQKTPNKDLQNASANFTLFSPTPNPQKRENPSRLKDFRGGSAAPARPRVAKAMLSNHHRTASPDLRAAAPAADPGQKKRFVCLRDDTRTKEFAQVRSSFAVTRRCLLLPFASDIFWCNPQSSQVRWMDVCVGDILWSFAWDIAFAASKMFIHFKHQLSTSGMPGSVFIQCGSQDIRI